MVGVFTIDGVQAESCFGEVSPYGEVGFAIRSEKVGYVHHDFGLGVRFQDVEDVDTNDSVKLSRWMFWAIVVVVADDVITLVMKQVGVGTVSAAEVEDTSFK